MKNETRMRQVFKVQNVDGLEFWSFVEPIPSRKEKLLEEYNIPEHLIEYLVFDMEDEDREIFKQELARW